MNKKVLSAILFSALFAGTGTFTSCIDNDEPAGIEDLRGAKAELLRAQAAFELAEVELKNAETALKMADVKAKEIANQMAQIDLEMKELDLKIKEAKAEAEIQEYLLQKQQKENAIAKLAETFKAEMLTAQKGTVTAQAALDQAIAQAEIAKLTLNAESQTLVDAALTNMNTKKTAMLTAYAEVVTAQNAVLTALQNETGAISLSKLENDLLKEQNNVKVKEIKVADAEKMLALAEDFDAETWAAQLDSLRADSLAAVQDKAAAQVDLDALYMGAEYQAAEKAYKDAVEAWGKKMKTNTGKFTHPATGSLGLSTTNSDKVYVKGELDANSSWQETYNEGKDTTLWKKWQLASADSTKAVVYGTYVYGKDQFGDDLNTKFALKEYKSEPVSESLVNFLNSATSPVKGMLSKESDGKSYFKYDFSSQKYTENLYRIDSINYKKAVAEGNEYTFANANSSAMKALLRVEGWVNALNTYKTDTNGIAWSQVYLDEERKDSADAQAAFDLAKAEWQVLVDAVNGESTEAPTDSLKKNDKGQIIFNADIATAIAAYNEALDSLTSAVNKHNNAIDTLKKYEGVVNQTAYDNYIAEQKAAKYLTLYVEQAKPFIPTNKQSDWDALLAKIGTDEEPEVTAFSALLAQADADKVDNSVTYDVEQFYKSNVKDGEEQNVDLKSLLEKATEAGYEAVETDYDAGNKSILAGYVKAITDEDEGTTALVQAANLKIAETWSAFQTIYGNYVEFLAKDYGQIVTATNLTVLKDSPTATDSVKIGEGKYITFTKEDLTSTINWTTVIEKDFGYKATAYSNKLDKDNENVTYASWSDYTTSVVEGVTTYTAAGSLYNYYAVVGSDISAAEEENLSVTEINKRLAINKLIGKSETAYGHFFDWKTDEQARLVEVTEEMVKADAEKNKKNINETNYGKLGDLMKEKAEVELILAQKDADKLVEPLLETLTAQFDTLKAEIAANSAIVAAVEKKSADAYAAYKAGEALVEKTMADRDALSAEAEAEIEMIEAIIAEKKAVIESATQQLEALFPGVQGLPGALTTEKLVLSWEQAVTNAKGEVESAKLAVAKAEQAIEMYKSGEYSQAYAVAQAQLALEAAQASYEAAAKLYELAASEFNAILEALAK